MIASEMQSSKRYRELCSRIGELRDHLLPEKFDPTGSYTGLEIDRIVAFRLMAHAEIESYLEEIAIETADKATDDWLNKGLITKPLLALVAYAEGTFGDLPDAKSSKLVSSLSERISTSKKRFSTFAKVENHGIKKWNILRLLLPVGIEEKELDEYWLSATTSFGADRGEVAHQSNRVYNRPDPESDYKTVNELLGGLKDIDKKLFELINNDN